MISFWSARVGSARMTRRMPWVTRIIRRRKRFLRRVLQRIFSGPKRLSSSSAGTPGIWAQSSCALRCFVFSLSPPSPSPSSLILPLFLLHWWSSDRTNKIPRAPVNNGRFRSVRTTSPQLAPILLNPCSKCAPRRASSIPPPGSTRDPTDLENENPPHRPTSVPSEKLALPPGQMAPLMGVGQATLPPHSDQCIQRRNWLQQHTILL